MLRSQRASPPALNLSQPDKLFFLMRSAPESDAFRLSDFCLHLLQIKPLPCRCAPAFGRAVENLSLAYPAFRFAKSGLAPQQPKIAAVGDPALKPRPTSSVASSPRDRAGLFSVAPGGAKGTFVYTKTTKTT